MVTVNLNVKKSVKHVVPIDNVIRIHISMYSMIVVEHDAYVRNGTLSERTIPLQFNELKH